jgi:hypothetical protein
MSMFSKLCSGGLMSIRRKCVSDARQSRHPFGTIKARMGATHFLMKTLPLVATEMALHILAYNMRRVMSIMGVRPLLAGSDEGRAAKHPSAAATASR